MYNQEEQMVAILIDFPNLATSAKHKERAKIDANCFHEQVRNRKEIRAIAYIAGNGYDDKFQHVLKKLGYEVKLFNHGKNKIDCDVMIAVDAIALSEKVDTIILGSGDGDYVPLIKYLKANGVKVEIMAIESTASFDLIKAADVFIPINSYMKNGR